jgi:HK97 family phage prohead protease
MGGFRVKIAPGYFTKVLDNNPDVHLLWDHNTRYVLARTRNNTLELREDPMGLHVWARFAKTQTADELATLMDGGYIDQMSFATDVGVSEWTEDSDGNLTWHLIEADPATGLTDVTVCAQGAFPQTDASLVASLNNAGALLASAVEAGHVTDVLIHTSSRPPGRANTVSLRPSSLRVPPVSRRPSSLRVLPTSRTATRPASPSFRTGRRPDT